MRGLLGLFTGLTLLFATMPSSTNYTLHNYDFGSGGGTSTSTNYGLNSSTGQATGPSTSSTTYTENPGNNNVQDSSEPFAPTVSNPSNYYDKLQFIVNPATSSPTDYTYAIAISSNGFSTTNYIQASDTIGTSPVFQTYSAWGGASGQLVLGLTYSTTYSFKVSAMQGSYTQSPYGPIATAATVSPSITFSIYTDSQVSPPFATSFGNLLAGTVTNAADKLWVNLTTNADNGANVWINSANGGLSSNHASSTISSATTNLTSASSGYGAQVAAVTQTSGGPLTSISPYNGSAQNVGALATSLTPIFATTAPITGGAGDLYLMAKSAATTPASNDYTDTLSFTVAGSF
jgi:hypothetical protein